MKCLEENALKKLISLFKGDLNEKADIDLCNVIPGEKAWIEGLKSVYFTGKEEVWN